MPDIGLLELILIGVVAFLVLGPERMPDLLSQVGSTVRHARKWMHEIKDQVRHETEGLKSEINATRGEVDDALSGGISTMPDDASGDGPESDPESSSDRGGRSQ